MAGAASGAGYAYSFGEPDVTPGLLWVLICHEKSVESSEITIMMYQPLEEDALSLQTLRAVKKFRDISLVMTLPSVLNLAVGIAIVLLRDGGGQPVNSGIQIISSLMVLFGAVFGLFLGKTLTGDEVAAVKLRQKSLIMVLYFTEAIAVFFIAWGTGYSIWGAIACNNRESNICGENFIAEQVLHIVSAILSSIMLISSFVSVVMVCYYQRLIWSI